jgi:hypothetical protein
MKELIVKECGCSYQEETKGDIVFCSNNLYCPKHQAEIEQASIKHQNEELLMQKKAEIAELEVKSLRKLYDGEDMTEINAKRLQLRNEIGELQCPS